MKVGSPVQRPIFVTILLAALVFLTVGSVVRSDLLSSVELQGYDSLILARGPAPPPENTWIVDFDDASVNLYNAFPIPRPLLAEVLLKVSTGQPAVIGLDVILDKKRSEEEDHLLTEALGSAGNVILVSEYGFEFLPPNEPLPEFQKAAAGVGFGDLPRDEDGIVRRMFLQLSKPRYQRLSFPLAVADYYSDQHLRPGGPGFHLFGSTKVPLIYTNPDSTLINFHQSFPGRVVPVMRLLASGFDPSVFKGKIVLVGQSSEVGKDLFSTPVFRFRPPSEDRSLLSGTEIHAAAITTLLSGKTVRKLSTPRLWSINFLLLWLLLWLLIKLRPVYGILTVIVSGLVVYLLALTLFSVSQTWMPFISSEVGVVLSLPAGLGYRFFNERRLKVLAEAERRQLMGLFERYVSPEVAAEIWQRREEIVLAGEEKTATVLFSDIRSFTALTAGKPSAQVLAWLNQYLTAMSEIIKANGGFLNKFIGDGIMVVFGVPLSKGVEDDACRAVLTALEMLNRVKELNDRLEADKSQLKIGVGIHTGPLTVGNVGSPDRLEYSVIGETVNLASRLESLTKEFKTGIVMSPATWEQVRTRFETVLLGEAEVRGFQGKLPLYTVQRQTPAEVKA